MIAGIGIDAVEINRFAHWQTFPHAMLRRIFSEDEISYCLASSTHSAERFAVRFAAREALFKALYSSELGNISVPFLKLCKHAHIIHLANNTPRFEIAWHQIGYSAQAPKVHVSLTHTRTTAIAYVILETYI